jgi:putative flippase GtrA
MSNRKKELLRSIKFTLFSISAGIIQILSYTLLFELLHLEEWLCNLISLALSVLWNFTLNRKYTFQSANNVPIAMLQTAAFYVVFAPLSSWWTNALTNIGWNAYLVEFGTMCVNFVTEFLFQRFVVFRKSLDTAPVGKEKE